MYPPQNRPGNQDQAPAFEPFQTEWITKSINLKCVEYTDKLGKRLKDDGLTTSQIRNFFGEVRRIQQKGLAENHAAFLLLLPKLAYVTGRADKKAAAQLFEEVFSKAIRTVNPDDSDKEAVENRFQRFCDFFEAVLAYHKKYGGK